MQEITEAAIINEPQNTSISPWRLIGWLCAGLIAASILTCVVMAAVRSAGLTEITVTALDAASEPRDHVLPLVKQKEALPDYELTLILTDGDRISLGTKPDTSAVDGLIWHINDPISIADVAGVRLFEQDKVISDAVAEVQILGESIIEKGYRFEFASKRSFSVGVKSFFGTPIGKAISAGFCIAVIVILVSLFRV